MEIYSPILSVKVLKIWTVGPMIMVMASSPTAKIRLVFDKIFTPFQRPERAEMVKRMVVIIMIITCTRALFGIPKR